MPKVTQGNQARRLQPDDSEIAEIMAILEGNPRLWSSFGRDGESFLISLRDGTERRFDTSAQLAEIVAMGVSA